MSAGAAVFEVKGWCPGALRPMESGDGLIVRVRPFGASLSTAEMRGIADAAARFGNGHIDLTRRANLQIRGVRDATLAPLQDALDGLGLLDDRPEAEAVRNILVSPLAGLDPSEALDMRPLARDLAEMLAAERETWALPGKFAFVLDGGGVLPLSAERGDLRLLAIRSNRQPLIAIGIAGEGGLQWLGAAKPDAIAGVVLVALREIVAKAVPPAGSLDAEAIARIGSRLTPLCPEAIASGQRTATASMRIGLLDLGNGAAALGLGVPFGRLEAAQLHALADTLPQDADASGIRLSPWRVVYIPLRDRLASEPLMLRAQSLGFVTGADDPLMRVQACPGSPACRSAHADTREVARALASWMRESGFPGTAHVSGCAKGCASSSPADLMLAGMPGGYRLMRNARASDDGGVFLASADIGARTALLARMTGGTRHG